MHWPYATHAEANKLANRPERSIVWVPISAEKPCKTAGQRAVLKFFGLEAPVLWDGNLDAPKLEGPPISPPQRRSTHPRKELEDDAPLDPQQAIHAQAHFMRDLLRQFGSVPLALAAYNAGPGAVAACGCIPPYPETRGYVARIMGLMNGAGAPLAADGLTVRLVR